MHNNQSESYVCSKPVVLIVILASCLKHKLISGTHQKKRIHKADISDHWK